MKIVHLCLSCFYIDNYAYQENMLVKYHQLMNHDVSVIASRYSFDDKTGRPTLVESGVYEDDYCKRIVRIPYKYSFLNFFINNRLGIYKNTYKELEKENPDVIFCHGIQFMDLKVVARYIEKHPHCKLIVDNHAAEINSGKNLFSSIILHKILYRKLIQNNKNAFSQFYNVTPGSEFFAKKYYKLSEKEMDLLFLGADLEMMSKEKMKKDRIQIRSKLGISEDSSVFITGGKIDANKNVIWLLENLDDLSIDFKFILFGPIAPEIKDEVMGLINNNSKIIYKEWLNPNEVYSYFAAADIGIFPGSKSALWEQAICTGLPLICKKWPGMSYVDVGGNCIFIDGNNKYEFINEVESLVHDRHKLKKMRNIAETKGVERFSYYNISEKSLESLEV